MLLHPHPSVPQAANPFQQNKLLHLPEEIHSFIYADSSLFQFERSLGVYLPRVFDGNLSVAIAPKRWAVSPSATLEQFYETQLAMIRVCKELQQSLKLQASVPLFVDADGPRRRYYTRLGMSAVNATSLTHPSESKVQEDERTPWWVMGSSADAFLRHMARFETLSQRPRDAEQVRHIREVIHSLSLPSQTEIQ